MSALLKQITDYHLLRGLFCQEIGLWEGKAGMSLFFFLLSRYTGNRWYEEFAGELLDDVCSSLSLHCPITFVDGLCGIGWAIEFLKKEGFIEGDTDEILAEVDRQVMERDVRRIADATLETGLAGIAAYVRSRLESGHTASNYHPFDPEYLSDLDNACQKSGIEWMSDAYSVTNLWQTIPSLLPSTDALAWQKGFMIINERHDYAPMVCGNLYQATFIKKNPQLHFEGEFHEDECFTLISQTHEKQIFVFTRGNRASRYGVGTYIDYFVRCFDLSIWNVHVIELYGEVTEYSSYIKEGVLYSRFPIPHNFNVIDAEKKYCKSIFYWIVSNYQLNDNDVYCHFNFTKDKEIVQLMKDKVNANIFFTMHYMEWKFDIIGEDEEILKQILRNPQNKKEINIVSKFQEEKFFMDKLCDKIITISKYSKKLLESLYKIDKHKIVYIPHGIIDTYKQRSLDELSQIRKKYNLSLNDKVVLYVGRLTNDKGLNILIEAFKRLQIHKQDLCLFIVGGGDFRYYLCQTEPSWKKIIFTGYLEKKALEELYAISDIGVIPSSHEELGYVAIEMLMNKLPFICSDASGLKEVTNNGKYAFMIHNWQNIDQVNVLENKIMKYIFIKETLRKVGERGRKKYLKDFHFEIYKDKNRAIL